MKTIKKVSLIGIGGAGSFFAPRLYNWLEKGDFRIIADGERKERIEKFGIIANGIKYDFPIVTPDMEGDPADLHEHLPSPVYEHGRAGRGALRSAEEHRRPRIRHFRRAWIWRQQPCRADHPRHGGNDAARAMGCVEQTFSGLAGVGDMIVTATSTYSRNNNCGRLIGEGMTPEEAVRTVGQTVEGIYALPAALQLAAKYQVEMPIVEAVDAIINHHADPARVALALMKRDPKSEDDRF